MSAVTQTEFAKIIGVQKSYVTELKKTGRLVFNDVGKILVEETKILMEKTKDPSKQGVADRHSVEREQKQQNEVAEKAGSVFQQSRAMKERYAAMTAKREYEKQTGELVESKIAKLAVMEGDVMIRSRLEGLPDILAPQLAAENDEQKIRLILIEQVEYVLNDISDTFKKLIYE